MKKSNLFRISCFLKNNFNIFQGISVVKERCLPSSESDIAEDDNTYLEMLNALNLCRRYIIAKMCHENSEFIKKFAN